MIQLIAQHSIQSIDNRQICLSSAYFAKPLTFYFTELQYESLLALWLSDCTEKAEKSVWEYAAFISETSWLWFESVL